MRKLTANDWDEFQKARPARYFIQSVEDGAKKVTFDSEVFVTEKGQEDMLGNVWEREWPKNEAKVLIDGEPRIYSMGGSGWSFINDFIAVCKANSITPENIPGSVFEITKTGDWTQEIKFLGREDGKTGKGAEIPLTKDKLDDAKDALKNLKSNSPEFVEGGMPRANLLKAIRIRAKIDTKDMESMLPELEKEGVIKLDGDTIHIL